MRSRLPASLALLSILAFAACGTTAEVDGGAGSSASGAAAGGGSSGGSGSTGSGASSGGNTGGATAGNTGGNSSSGGSGGDDAGLTCPQPPGSCTPCPGYPGNSINVGAYCTKGGGQCPFLVTACAADEPGGAGQNYCVVIDCPTYSDGGYDCGANACCYGESGNPIHACVPFGCVTVDGVSCPPIP